MVSELLNKLPAYEDKAVLIEQNQTTKDIAAALLAAHRKYAADYDRIYKFFDKKTVWSVANCLFNFLKKNVRYVIEPDKWQTVKSPAAILATGQSTGSDCKNYALFIGGILDSISRNSEKIDWCYRFAGYNPMVKDVEHVFVVVNPNTKNEIWIDPVLNFLDERKNPTFIIDKTVKTMPLYSVSGVGSTSLNRGTSARLQKKDITALAAKALPGGSFIPYDEILNIIKKGGVSPNFFESFKFLSFLDNSTGQWKSRLAFLKNRTPEERISFYIDALNRGEDCTKTAIQYSELFGKSFKGSGIDDRGKVPAALLDLFNRLAEEKLFKGSNSFQCGKWSYTKDYVLQDVSSAPDYQTYKVELKKTDSTQKAGLNPLLILGIGAAAFMFLKK